MATWLQERAAAAGFSSLAKLDRSLGLSQGSTSRWSRGIRPVTAQLRVLSAALGTTEAEIVASLWGEALGAPCTCSAGCGGVYTLPDVPGARTLDVSRACGTCGKITVYRDRGNHHPLCNGCSQHRVPDVTLTCDLCGESRQMKRSNLRVKVRRGQYPDAMINWELSSGVARCRACNGRTQTVSRVKALTKRRGKAALVPLAGRFRTAKADRVRGWENSRATRLGRPLTPEHRTKLALAHLRPRPVGTFGLCRICGLLCFTQHPGDGFAAETHKACLEAWRSGEGRVKGRNAYPPRPRGRRPNAQELADSYDAVIRQTVRHHELGQLAAEFSLDERTVQYRIEAFLDRLPRDGRGGIFITRIAALLLPKE